MAKNDAIRNIGIIAHIDAGKTTTTERMLFYTGVSHHMGTVDQGNTITDWMEQEKERGITITSATIACTWRDHAINIIDTPGHVDFTAEVERALRVLDGAIVVLDSVAGVEPQSEMVWGQARRHHIPCIVVVNKMDRLGADFEGALEDIRDKLHASALPIHWPIGAEEHFEGVVDLLRWRALYWDTEDDGRTVREEDVPSTVEDAAQLARDTLLETLAGEDEKLLERFAAGEELSVEALQGTLRRCVLTGQLVPVLASAALRNKGIQPILDAVVDYLPAPADVPAPKGQDASGEERSLLPDPEAGLAALVFKTYTDADRRRISYVRVYSGTLNRGDQVRNVTSGETERVARLVRMQADRQKKLDALLAGDIGVVVGLKHARTGDTLCAPEDHVVLAGMAFPEPVVSASLEAKTSADEERIQTALEMLAADDPTFAVKEDANTGQRIISGMGELHLEVIADRLRGEFRLPVRIGKPQVEYRETITAGTTAEATFERITGGKEHFASVSLALAPRSPGEGNRVRFAPDVVLPAPLPDVLERSASGALGAGVVGGYRVIDVDVHVRSVTLREGAATEMAIAGATTNAIKEALKAGRSVLLAPVMKLEIVAPKEFVGSILTGLAGRKGRVSGTELRGPTQVVSAHVPLAAMFGYATELRSATQGRGTYSMHFERFDSVDAEEGSSA